MATGGSGLAQHRERLEEFDWPLADDDLCLNAGTVVDDLHCNQCAIYRFLFDQCQRQAETAPWPRPYHDACQAPNNSLENAICVSNKEMDRAVELGEADTAYVNEHAADNSA